MSHSAHTSISSLEEIVGHRHVHTEQPFLDGRRVDGMTPSVVVQPAAAAEVAEIVRFAASERLAIVACGNGTKLGIGAPPERYDVTLDLSRMNRVLAYDPDDLTLGVEPGVMVQNLLLTLREQKQFLPLHIPFSERATVGGAVAANSNSPLRHSYGGIRDYCLGMEFVTGEGVMSKSGGRVVKNVTGYDLHKLLIGSLGTLAIITRVNFRTFPVPRLQRTFIASFSNAADAFALCAAIGKSVLTPQILEVISPGAADLFLSAQAFSYLEKAAWSVVITAAGYSAVVERYEKELGRMTSAANANRFEILGDAEASWLLTRVCEFPRLALDVTPEALIFRISVLPTVITALLANFGGAAEQHHLNLATISRASGFLYAVFAPRQGDTTSRASLAAMASDVFRLCAAPQIEARAMMESCPVDVKRECNVWGALRPDFALMQRVKNIFDPQRVLSPGRFVGGI